MKFIYTPGATPYLDGDISNLIPKHITLQSELNEWEQANILEAEHWLFAKNRKNILSPDFIKKVHYKMFMNTWKWAGKFRKHQTNIGCQFFEIPSKLQQLLYSKTFGYINFFFLLNLQALF
jgi:fido (protein-threonine AMPylation protein)